MPPNNIAPPNFELWMGRIHLETPISPVEAQAAVTQYVEEHRTPVVGYLTLEPPALTLLRWPDNRKGYATPTSNECDMALSALARRLNARSTEKNIVPAGKIHTMMGRKIDGYGKGVEVSLEQLKRNLPDYTVVDGYMISARVDGKTIESYGEKVGVIVTDQQHEHVIHEIGDALQQHHYAIERAPVDSAPGRTDFYETRWANQQTNRHK